MEKNDGVKLKQKFLEAKREYIWFLVNDKEMEEYNQRLSSLSTEELLEEAKRIHYLFEDGKVSEEVYDKVAFRLDCVLFTLDDLILQKGEKLLDNDVKRR